MALLGKLVDHLVVALEQARIHADVLMDRDGGAAAPRPGDQPQDASLVRVRDRLLLVARLISTAVRHDPDLQEVDRLARRRIELAMGHARARAHPLDLARPDHRPGAEAVAMLQGSAEDVADDLHVPVAVRGKAAAGLHAVLVDHSQGAEAHVARVVVLAERERVRGVEPAEIEMAAVGGRAAGDHSWVPDWPASRIRRRRSSSGLTYFSRQSGQIP